MKKFFLLFFIPVIVTFAQQSSIKGKVINDKAVPILGATILIVGTTQGTSANENGYFEIKNLPAGSYNIQISAVGYEKQIFSKVRTTTSDEQLTVVLKEVSIPAPFLAFAWNVYAVEGVNPLTVITLLAGIDTHVGVDVNPPEALT